MRWPVACLSSLGLVLITAAAMANGGGYSFGVKFTGSLAPFQASGTQQVQILEEKLDINLRRTDADVVVRYTMRNVANKPAQVKFGFPVEATHSDEDLGSDEGSEGQGAVPLSLAEARRKDLLSAIQQLKGYAVTLDGNPVSSEFLIEPFATGKIKPFPGSSALNHIAGWMVSDVTFPASAVVQVEIRYAADYMGDESFVSDDESWSPRTFVYRLSTGSVWNGPIQKGTVTVRVDGIPSDEVELSKPREQFKRDAGKWVWAFRNLKPTLADDITIKAIPGYDEHSLQDGLEERPSFKTYLHRGGKWGEGHQRFKASASSTLAPAKDHAFGPEHLSEPWPEFPWAEGVKGPGLGEWVELGPERPAPLLALAVQTGFPSSKRRELFKQNGRPSRIEVALNGEFRFTATLGDEDGSQLIPVIGYAKPVSKLRITLLDVYPGTRFEDTCLSKIVLYDLLRKKPEFNPSR